jgi:hypothetical protein
MKIKVDENKLKNFFRGELFSFQSVLHENISCKFSKLTQYDFLWPKMTLPDIINTKTSKVRVSHNLTLINSIVYGDLFIDRKFSIYAHIIFYEMISIIN